MVLIGRLTKDAVVNQLKDERKVVNFTVVVNDAYKPKGREEWKTYASFFNCAYWVSAAIAPLLKKGILVEVTGRIYVSAYKDTEDAAKATLHCHVSAIKIHTGQAKKQSEDAPAVEQKAQDDLPF